MRKVISLFISIILFAAVLPYPALAVEPISVVSVSPANNSYAEPYQPIVISFSGKPSSLEAIRLMADGDSVSCSVLALGNNTYRLEPKEGLRSESKYKLVIPSSVTNSSAGDFESCFSTYGRRYTGIKTLYKYINFEQEGHVPGQPPEKTAGVTCAVSHNANMEVANVANSLGMANKAAKVNMDESKGLYFYSKKWDDSLPNALPDRLVIRASLMSESNEPAGDIYICLDNDKKELFRFGLRNANLQFCRTDGIGVTCDIAPGQWYDVEIALDASGADDGKVVVEYASVNGVMDPRLFRMPCDLTIAEYRAVTEITGVVYKANGTKNVNCYIDDFMVYEPLGIKAEGVIKYDTFNQYSTLRYNGSTYSQTAADPAHMANSAYPYYITKVSGKTTGIDMGICALENNTTAVKALYLENKSENEKGYVYVWDKSAFGETPFDGAFFLDMSYMADASSSGGRVEICVGDVGGGEHVIASIEKDAVSLTDNDKIAASQGEFHRLVMALRSGESEILADGITLDGAEYKTPNANAIPIAAKDISAVYIKSTAGKSVSNKILLSHIILARECITEKPFVYVSSDGNDKNDGTAERPVATLNGARELVRSKKAILRNTPIEVIFREGQYVFESGVEFNSYDSGEDNAPITYRAADGENAVFTGSKKVDISGMSPVSDDAVRKRIPEEARGEVYQINLGAQGLDFDTFIPYIPYTIPTSNYGADVELFVDGKRQPRAQWPNGDGEFEVAVNMIDDGEDGINVPGTGGSFEYSGERPARWTEASDMYVKGFFTNDWRNFSLGVASIDTANHTIALERGYGGEMITSYRSKRWKAMNLLEELDSPGEWYIDRTKDILYFYPPYSMDGAEVEISALKDKMITLRGASHLQFCGITFTKTCGSAIYAEAPSEGVKLQNCVFSNIGQRGVESWSYRYGSMGDNAENRKGMNKYTIENNLFFDVGQEAIRLIGGDMDTLETSNHCIRNNYFYANSYSGVYPAIRLSAVGSVVENNLVHYGEGAISFIGNENEIRYNELYNAGRTISDTGAIYTGRSYLRRGNTVSYNYIHDVNPVEKIISASPNHRGVYLDDHIAGQNIHHNIIANSQKGVTLNGGQANNISDNIIVDCSKGVETTTRNMDSEERKASEREQAQQALANPAYSRYPYVAEGIEAAYAAKPAFNTISGNLLVKSANDISAIYNEISTVQNNVELDTFDGFVNPNGQDYRITADADILNTLPGLWSTETDVGKIGLQISKFDAGKLPEKAFTALYPQNGSASVKAGSITFLWEHAFGADQYRFVLADNPQLGEPMIDQIVNWNYIEVSELLPGMKYYWQVYAVNKSKSLSDIWQSSARAYSFETAKAVINNVEFLSPDDQPAVLSQCGGEEVKAVFDASGKSGTEYTMIFAFYHEGRLYSTQIFSDVIGDDVSKCELRLKIPDRIAKGDVLTIFVWSDKQGLKPLSEPKNYPI